MTNNKALLYKLLNSGSCLFVLCFLLVVFRFCFFGAEIGFRDGILYNKNLKYVALTLGTGSEERPEWWQRVEACKAGRIIPSHLLNILRHPRLSAVLAISPTLSYATGQGTLDSDLTA